MDNNEGKKDKVQRKQGCGLLMWALVIAISVTLLLPAGLSNDVKRCDIYGLEFSSDKDLDEGKSDARQCNPGEENAELETD